MNNLRMIGFENMAADGTIYESHEAMVADAKRLMAAQGHVYTSVNSGMVLLSGRQVRAAQKAAEKAARKADAELCAELGYTNEDDFDAAMGEMGISL